MVRRPDSERIERQRAAIEPLNAQGFNSAEIAYLLGIPRNRVRYVMAACGIKSVCGAGNVHGRSKDGGGGKANPAARERDRDLIEPLVAMAYTIAEIAEGLGLTYGRVNYVMNYYGIASARGPGRPSGSRAHLPAQVANFDFEDTDEL